MVRLLYGDLPAPVDLARLPSPPVCSPSPCWATPTAEAEVRISNLAVFLNDYDVTVDGGPVRGGAERAA